MKTLNIGDCLILDDMQYMITDVFCKSLSGNVYCVKDEFGEFFVIKEFIDEKLTDGNRCNDTNCARFKTDCDILSSSALKLARKEVDFHRTALNNGSNNNPFVFSVKQYNMNAENLNTPYLRINTKTGYTLENYIYKHNKSDVAESIKIMKAICEAVNTLHGNSILHLDLKPQNIYILQQGDYIWPIILDFGSAQRIGDVDLQTFDLSSGTREYSSPNIQSLSNELSVFEKESLLRQISQKDDIYSICCILLKTLIGVSYTKIIDRLPRAIDESRDDFLRNDLAKFGTKELESTCFWIERMFSKLDDNQYTCIKSKTPDDESSFYHDLVIFEEIAKHKGYHPENIKFFGKKYIKDYLDMRNICIIPQMLAEIEPRGSQ